MECMKTQSNFLKSLVAGTGFIILTTSLISPALAQTVTQTPTGTPKPTTTKKPSETAAQKCARITKKVDEKKTELQSSTTNEPELFNGLIKRNEDFAQKLKAEGYDTTELVSDIAKLKTLVSQRSSLRLTLALAALDKVKDIQCNKAPKEDIQKVFDAKKTEYLAAKDKFQSDVKSVLAEIRDDLQAIREQRKTTRSGATVKPSKTPKPSESEQKEEQEGRNPNATKKPTERPKSSIKPTQTIKPSATVKITATVKPTVTATSTSGHSGSDDNE